MERARDRLALLLRLTAGLAEHMDVRSIAEFVLSAGRSAVDANRGTLCLVADDREHIEVVAHVGYDTDVMQHWHRFRIDQPVPASDAVRTRSAVYVLDADDRTTR